MAEEYSDAVAVLLAKRWDQFGSFARLAKKSPSFGRWAIRHIDATAAPDDLTKIVHNTAHCAGTGVPKHLCREVRSAAIIALKE